MEVSLRTSNEEEVILFLVKDPNSEGERIYNLMDSDNTLKIRLKETESENGFEIDYQSLILEESSDSLAQKLDSLYLAVIESEQSGTDLTEGISEEISPYNPDDIKVSSKSFGINLINQMIDDGYLDLNPDFQRNFVWDRTRKSRLIESILLRIPLPMFYFAEDNEGKISVVDGLQRLTTIKEYIDGKFKLTNLEYLKDSCQGLYYKNTTEEANNGLPAKYYRWFNMTQLSVNVIDPSSPTKVKYDIFRRINEGGKPLNNQEIRNCLASNNLRTLLRKMTSLDSFQSATLHSIKSTRMEDQDVALRFISFYQFKHSGGITMYNGNMEGTLDNVVETLSKLPETDLNRFIAPFDQAMKSAEYLFCNYAFRKVRPQHLEEGARKQLINKALFLCWSVLLADILHETIRSEFQECELAITLARRIAEHEEFFNYLTYGTNGKANLLHIYDQCESMLEPVLNRE